MESVPKLSNDQLAFLERVKQAAMASEELSVPPAVVVGQSILESNWGRSPSARTANNLFGIKARPTWEGSVYSGTTDEWEGGQNVTHQGKDRLYSSYREAVADNCDPATLFRAYVTDEDSVRDHATFLQRPRYQQCLKGYRRDRDARAFALCIHKAGYATDPNYGPKVIKMMEQYVPDLLA